MVARALGDDGRRHRDRRLPPGRGSQDGDGGRLIPSGGAQVAYVALFRGINVGGRHLLPMQELVAVLADLGARHVRTYIQSGNAVFLSEERDGSRLAGAIREAVRERFGFEPHVLLLRVGELERAARDNPFPEAESEPAALHLGFLATEPQAPRMDALESLRANGERYRLVGRVFYLHAPAGIGRSKLAAAAERLLGVPMTDRNWRTVCAIAEMGRRIDGDARD